MELYPITQAQWKAVVTQVPKIQRDLESDPSYFTLFKGSNWPIETVSWLDVVEFCARLSKYTGKAYSLPSEAQWEYACRAGTTTPFHFGKTITTDLANYNGDYTYAAAPIGQDRSNTTPVGSFSNTTPVSSFKVANSFGLYDMHGNVWEWCLDDWHDNYVGAPTDGSAWFDNDNNLTEKEGRTVLRGGSERDEPGHSRSANRYYYHWRKRVPVTGNVGFRVVCAL